MSKQGFLHREVAGRELGIWFFIILFPAVFILGGGHLLLGWASDYLRARAAAHWFIHSGTIEGSTVLWGKQSISGARIVYTYEAVGGLYRSSGAMFGAVSPSDAMELVARYRVGDTVDVFVNPSDLSESVLEPRLGSSSWLMPGLGVALLLVGFLVGRFVEKHSRPGARRAPDDRAAPAPSRRPLAPRSGPPSPLWKRLSPYWADPPNEPYALISALVLVFLFGGAVIKTLERDRHEAELANRYAMTTGELVSVDVVWQERMLGNFRGPSTSSAENRATIVESYRIDVVYRYVVEGHAYTGTRITSSDQAFGIEADAHARLDDLRKASPLMVYYDPEYPAAAVLDQQYRPNIKSPWFWVSALLFVIALLIAVREVRRLSPVAFHWLRRIAPAGLVFTAALLAVDLTILAWYQPAAMRLVPVEGYLVEIKHEDGWPPRVGIDALYLPPGETESVPGGAWRLGLMFIWTESGLEELREREKTGLRTFWIDPASPSRVVMNREVGAMLSGTWRVVIALLALGFLAVLIDQRRRRTAIAPAGSNDGSP